MYAISSERFMDLDDDMITVYNGSSLGGLPEIAKVRKNFCAEFNIQVGDSLEFRKSDKMIRAVFFDWSGTLLERSFLEKEDLGVFAARYEIDVDMYVREFNRIFLLRENEDLDLAVEELVKVMKPTDEISFKNEVKGFVRRLDQESVLKDWAKSLLLALKEKGYFIGLIANMDSFTLGAIDRFGLPFDVLISSCKYGITKPDEGLFKIALEKANVHPAEAIYVGDSLKKDIAPAKKVGMSAIHLTAETDLKEELRLYGVNI